MFAPLRQRRSQNSHSRTNFPASCVIRSTKLNNSEDQIAKAYSPLVEQKKQAREEHSSRPNLAGFRLHSMLNQSDPRASPSAMDSGGGSSAEMEMDMEMAWHLLTVLIRLGRPAATSELAAAAAAPTRFVEQMCCLPRSPLRISDDGVVTPSETAVLAFLRFMGWDIQGPKVSLRPSDVRRWLGKVSITYQRKRQGSDARRFSAKRRRLLAPDAGSFIS